MDHHVSMLNHSHYHKKPLCDGQLVNDLKIEGRQTIIVGDRLMTDMCLGHRLNGLSIYVRPWNTDTEQRNIAVSRCLENFVWRSMMKCELSRHDNATVNDLANQSRAN